uniref:Uncharacterized protein n=1 Tax=Arundo donax TaxID=35708 RepID=A0A0A9B5D2_ARUDO
MASPPTSTATIWASTSTPSSPWCPPTRPRRPGT